MTLHTPTLAPSGVMLHRNARHAGGESGDPADVVQALAGEDSWSNPWHLAWSSEHVDGPTALRVDFGDPWDFSDSERVLLLWDSAGLPVVVEKTTVEEGSSRVFEVPEKRGTRLELWVTDKNVPVSVTAIPFHQAKAERENIARKNNANDPLGDVIDAITGMQTLALVAAVIVAIVAGPSLVKAFRG